MTAARPFYTKKQYWVFAAIVVLGVGAALVGSSSSGHATDHNVAHTVTTVPSVRADVTVTSCRYNAWSKWGSATLALVNHGSKLSDYLITVDYENSAGALLGSDGSVTATTVPPGHTATAVSGFTLTAPPDRVICKVASVQRFDS